MDANVDDAGSGIRRRLRAPALCRCRSCRPAPAAAEEEEQVRDWTGLPEELMLIAMGSMEVFDFISSGLVCSSWRTAYKTFRRLRLPTAPNQSPCLLYAPRPIISEEEEDGPPPMMLYSPSTDVNLCLRSSSRLRGVAGSAYGWLFAMDEVANPYLVNPLTGAEAALPPITTLEHVRGSFTDEDGGVVYYVEYVRPDRVEVRRVTAQMARDDIYQRVAVSAAPGGAAAECVVLLLHTHMLYWEVSYARVGDKRWISISHQLRSSFNVNDIITIDGMQIAAAGAGNDHLFYLMLSDGFVYVLDLGGTDAVVSRTKIHLTYPTSCYTYSKYLVVAPHSGELLLVTRRLIREYDPDNDDDRPAWQKATTTEVHVDKVDLEARRMVRLAGIGEEHALFLGHGSPVWVPAAKDDHPLLRPNCVYLTDDSMGTYPPIVREDVAVWDFGSSCLTKLDRAWPRRLYPWLDDPAPIWITPSLY